MKEKVSLLEAYQDFIGCVPNLFLYTLDANGEILYQNSNQPGASMFFHLFHACGYVDKVQDYALQESDDLPPFALSIYIGLVWYAIIEKKNKQLLAIHLLGPVTYSHLSSQRIEESLRSYESQGMHVHAKHQLMGQIENLPVISHSQFAHYALMLHYAVTGTRLNASDILSLPDTPDPEHIPSHKDFYATFASYDTLMPSIDPNTYENIWRSETTILSAISNASANLEHSLSPDTNNPAHMHITLLPTDAAAIKDSSRQQKNSFIILLAHICRQAVAAGALPESSYRLADFYLGEIETTIPQWAFKN